MSVNEYCNAKVDGTLHKKNGKLLTYRVERGSQCVEFYKELYERRRWEQIVKEIAPEPWYLIGRERHPGYKYKSYREEGDIEHYPLAVSKEE